MNPALLLDDSAAVTFAFFFIMVIVVGISVAYQVSRRANGEVYIGNGWNGLWVPKRALRNHIMGTEPSPRIRRRARKTLPSRARYLCFSCDSPVPVGSHFCPQCGDAQEGKAPEIALPRSRKRRAGGLSRGKL